MLIRENLESSTIMSLAYDKTDQKMWIRFKSGALYEYRGVDAEVVSNMLLAESKGKFFHENIKNKFDYEKVEEQE